MKIEDEHKRRHWPPRSALADWLRLERAEREGGLAGIIREGLRMAEECDELR